MTDDDYTFGRSDVCDYCFEQRGGKANQHHLTFSSTHFRIYKVRIRKKLYVLLGMHVHQATERLLVAGCSVNYTLTICMCCLFIVRSYPILLPLNIPISCGVGISGRLS